ncbi:MAG: hypothetical protein ACHQ9S_23335 [Candidatus Binatia bacterium]
MTGGWTPRRAALGWTLGTLILCAAHATNAQVPWGLGRWQGDGTFFLDWEKQDDKRLQTKYETILFQERLGLRNVGAFILDPKFLTLNLGGSFGGSQEDGIALTNTPLRVGNGTLYDYAFDGLFLSDKLYPVRLFATRNQSVLTQGFGGRSDVSFESRGGTFDLREGNFLKDYGLLNFSSFLDARQEFLKEDSSVFGSPFRRDESRNIVRYDAHKGGETSDFDLRYELNDVKDPLNPTNVFDSHTVHAAHSLDFGPTLNRRLDSTLYYFKRTGSGPGSYLSVDEGLHLDHSSDFATDYRGDFSQSDSDAGVVTTKAASIGLLHRFYRTLTTTLDVRGIRQDFPTGARTIYGGQGGLDYRRALPWSGQFFADTYLGYQIDDNNFTSSSISVVDEPHTAPPFIGAGAGFTLNNSFVQTDASTNCLAGLLSGVVDVRGGSRLPTTCNVDYVLSPEGSLTKIIPLPGSSVIQANDPLEVSYTYNIDASIKYSTTNLNAQAGVEFPWLAASYEHALSNQTRLAGTPTPQFLINQNFDRLKLELRRQWNDFRVRSAVAYETLRSTVVDSNTWRFDQLVAYQPSSEIVAQIYGDQYFVDYPGQSRRSQSYLARATIDWFPPIGVSVTTFTGYREFHDTAIPSDEIIDAGVRARWTFHNLEVSPSVTWTDYRSRLSEIRGELRITRHLF